MYINSNLLLLGTLLLLSVEGFPIEPSSADMVGKLDELFAAADEIAHEELDEIEYGALLPATSRSPELRSELHNDEYDNDLLSLKNLASSENIKIRDDERFLSEIKGGPNSRLLIDKKSGKSLIDALKSSNPSSSERNTDIEENYDDLVLDAIRKHHKTSKIKDDKDSTLYKKERVDKNSKSLDKTNYDDLPSHKSDSILSSKINFHDDDLKKSGSKMESENMLTKDKKPVEISEGESKKYIPNSEAPKNTEKRKLPAELGEEPTAHADNSKKESNEVDYVKQLEQLTHVANNFIESKDFKSLASEMLKGKVDKLINEKGEAYLDLAKKRIDSYVPTIVEDVQQNIEDLEIGAAAGVAAKYMNLF
ncbi:hypothetical protein CONCODRAFT_72350 [Conidiobolus coronatus NRRL 28638]|uniref:Uncharacterized protein n=1 Tax=Conidiobolus coronatus (strain ATCC 28846 / CBS 209.66 / NRRL 28638) TaxID=796925 RepID=A0A137P086_CONC2|nr:hypothetical protein CONCODRAFT_72350 [Conidiobolus coronatus NRRL 28638]|eukprot:KXN68284.1 hypothetical protein CONCODRAFT_72350 [Conidiobolus coronatus NRRL 28638]